MAGAAAGRRRGGAKTLRRQLYDLYGDYDDYPPEELTGTALARMMMEYANRGARQFTSKAITRARMKRTFPIEGYFTLVFPDEQGQYEASFVDMCVQFRGAD